MSALITVKTALISVSDKTGVAIFAKALHELGVTILSTGGTSKFLQENAIPVTDVSDVTQFPEMLDGRVKTLHPKIHAGILRRPLIDDDVLKQHGINPIDLVVVNLYPFEAVIQNPKTTLDTAIENIDIGGPTMLRAAAKNYQAVGVVVRTDDYAEVINELKAHQGALTLGLRFELAKKAFSHTAKYDAAIANYLNCIDMDEQKTTSFPSTYSCQFVKKQELRYGENPHQKAAFYTEAGLTTPSVATAIQLQGKELSFNNIADTDTALECVKQFCGQTACVIVKHANPCGVAVGHDLLDAYQKAYKTDPTSAFGGIIAFNRTLTLETANQIINNQFVEVIIAPDVAKNALEILATKPNIRVLTCGELQHSTSASMDFKKVCGGLLIQDQDLLEVRAKDIDIVSQRQPSEADLTDLLFAWKVAKFVKSNAIVYAKQGMTIGIGAGQMSRVYSARIAGIKACDMGLVVKGSVMASDAFFPFRDSVDEAAALGITAIIQPGGSIRDQEVIAAADEHGIAMVFTKVRHFRH